jgi:hypothetical protein
MLHFDTHHLLANAHLLKEVPLFLQVMSVSIVVILTSKVLFS